MKKAFTLAEVLITLTIVGVLAAITIPTVVQGVDSNDHRLYKSAFKNVEQVVGELVADYTTFPGGTLTNASDEFCTAFLKRVNTISEQACSSASSVAATPNFTSTNAMRWYGLESTFAEDADHCSGSSCIIISVDIDGVNNGNNAINEDILQIVIHNTGKVTTETLTNSDGTVEQGYLVQ